MDPATSCRMTRERVQDDKGASAVINYGYLQLRFRFVRRMTAGGVFGQGDELRRFCKPIKPRSFGNKGFQPLVSSRRRAK